MPPDHLYRIPGFPAFLLSLAIVATLLLTAAGITVSAAVSPAVQVATPEPIGTTPVEVAQWVHFAAPRRR